MRQFGEDRPGFQYQPMVFDPPVWTPERRDYMLQPEYRLIIDGNGYLHVLKSRGSAASLMKEHYHIMKST